MELFGSMSKQIQAQDAHGQVMMLLAIANSLLKLSIILKPKEKHLEFMHHIICGKVFLAAILLVLPYPVILFGMLTMTANKHSLTSKLLEDGLNLT